MTKILVIDDRPDIRLSLVILLEDNGYQVIEADNPQSAQMQLKSTPVDIIMLDMNFALDTTSGEEGLAFLLWLKNSSYNIPAIAMTAWSNIDLVVKAMKLGASDFIEKPWRNKQLLHTVAQQLKVLDLQHENSKLKQQLSDKSIQPYQWQSPCMQQLLKKITAVANTDVSILFTGENGTGKSELANFIHQHSNRSSDPFVAVNMGAIVETLFESEMFGHIKGAFTDAKTVRIGRFALAEKGTLFLDEIANIPLSQQAKLLRILESGEYEALGSSKTETTNVRIISATNGDVTQLCANDEFREDLYYRLNTIEFTIPPLRERQQDIVPLAEFFIEQYGHKYKRSRKILSDEAKSALLTYTWPGNIRELSHLIERALLLVESEEITLNDLPLINGNIKSAEGNGELSLMTLEEAEILLIKKAMQQTDNHTPKAAVLLGLTKSSMYRRLEKYDLAQK